METPLMSDDTEADYTFLDDEDDTSEAPESEPVDETLWIAVGVSPTGFSLNVPETVNPITLAGVGWYLQQLAEVAVGNQMMVRAQAEAEAQRNAPALLVPRDHLKKGQRN